MSRKKAEAFWFEYLNRIKKGNPNVAMYKKIFGDMNDKEFGVFMERFNPEAEEPEYLPYYDPSLLEESLDVNALFATGDWLGLSYYKQLWLVDPVTDVKYLTNDEYLVMDCIDRRQAQHLVKGKSVSKDDMQTDATTGQPVGKARTSRISNPELVVLDAKGLLNVATEFLKVKGGDGTAYNFSKSETAVSGTYSLEAAAELNSRPTSTETTKAILLAMHIDNNV